MKRCFAFGLACILVFSLSACTLGAEKLTGEYEGYYLAKEDGILSVTNYAPYDFFHLPDYQELAEYGDGAGLDNEGIVYYIFITDTSKEDTYYTAEFDENRKLLCEEDKFFADEETKTQAVNRLLNMLDDLKAQHIK